MSDLSARARKKIQEQQEKAEKDRQVAMFKQRMDIARMGVLYYQQGKYKEALEHFYRYLGILEQWKKVKSGQLELRHFDQKKDVAELLLLSGIFWDLAKLVDRSAKKDKSQLRINLDKFVMFAKGMPYQHMCAELVRKYLMNDKPQNRAIFKDAHIQLGGGKCFIATAVEDYCAADTLFWLRKYRDERLLPHRMGRVFVRTYYIIGPYIARLTLRLPLFVQKKLAHVFDKISISVR